VSAGKREGKEGFVAAVKAVICNKPGRSAKKREEGALASHQKKGVVSSPTGRVGRGEGNERAQTFRRLKTGEGGEGKGGGKKD